jgi:hypothetical protein
MAGCFTSPCVCIMVLGVLIPAIVVLANGVLQCTQSLVVGLKYPRHALPGSSSGDNHRLASLSTTGRTELCVSSQLHCDGGITRMILTPINEILCESCLE